MSDRYHEQGSQHHMPGAMPGQAFAMNMAQPPAGAPHEQLPPPYQPYDSDSHPDDEATQIIPLPDPEIVEATADDDPDRTQVYEPVIDDSDVVTVPEPNVVPDDANYYPDPEAGSDSETSEVETDGGFRWTPKRIGAALVGLVIAAGAVTIVAEHHSATMSKQAVVELQQDNDRLLKSLKHQKQLSGDLQTAAQSSQAQQGARAVGIAESLVGNEFTSDELAGKGLRPITSLPAYGNTVSNDAAASLQASTVAIDVRTRANGFTPAGPWIGKCSGTVITNQSVRYVLTAGHCIDLRKTPQAVLNADNHYLAENVTRNTIYQYGIASPTDGQLTSANPIDAVSGISFDTAGHDFALLKVASLPGDAFDQIPAIDAAAYDSAPEPSDQGAGVAINGFTDASGDDIRTGKGIYLGEVPSQPGSKVMLDIVGVEGTTTPDQDPCMYGTSGSSGIEGDESDESMLGTARTHRSIGYNQVLPDGFEDKEEFRGMTAEQIRRYYTQENLDYEKSTGNDILGAGLGNVCVYNRADDQTISSLVGGLSVQYRP